MFLTRTADIRSRIREILKPSNGRRIAIVAFVGRDACQFIGDPKGLEVYCWPNPAATNPDGVRDLIRAGAKVYFVDRLHMKVFWSKGGGYLVGSPNLSSNALDDSLASFLLESAVFESSSDSLTAEALLEQLKRRGIQEATPALIRKLEDDYYSRPAYRRATSVEETPRSTFGEYLSDPNAQPFAFASWYSKDKSSKLERERALTYRDQQLGTTSKSNRDYVKDSVITKLDKHPKWVLTIRITGGGQRIGKPEWLYAHTSAPYYSSNVLIQVAGVAHPPPPFELDSDGFRSRFEAYLKHRWPSLYSAEGIFSAKQFIRFEA